MGIDLVSDNYKKNGERKVTGSLHRKVEFQKSHRWAERGNEKGVAQGNEIR